MKRFLAAAAIAPLCFAALEARAQTTINDARTAPVQTSTTGDLTIGAGGSITVPGGAAVTLDSNNTFSNAGLLQIQNATTEATGLLVTSSAGTINNSGTINITDNEELKDLDGDGDTDGPYVSATTPRFGIHVLNPFTGAITNSGQILIRGNNSAGLLVDNGVTGNVSLGGGFVVVGSNSYGARLLGPIVGNVEQTGSISATGENAVGLAVEGPVTGRLVLNGAISATGFRYNYRGTDAQMAKLDADDLLLGGPAVKITQSVSGGILVNGARGNTDDLDPDDNSSTPDITDPNPDEDHDGILDTADLTSSTITSYGPAPALQVGGADAITLGAVGTDVSGYGLVIQGTVTGNGVFDGYSATGAQIGGLGGTVDTGAGISNSGTISGNAVLADATGLNLAAGAIAPTLLNNGSIQAQSTSTAAGSAEPDVTALRIGAGATLGALTNNGSVIAVIAGPKGTATAVLDEAGSLGQITNTGSITAIVQPNDASETLTGHGVALDLRNNTAGVTVTQSANANAALSPSITGDILFGSGSANLNLQQGKITGDVAFGSGTNTFVINGSKSTTVDGVTTTVPDATFLGALTNTGSLSVSVLSGSLLNTSSAAVNLTSLDIGSAGTIGVMVDPAAQGGSRATQYIVSGAANLADGAKIDVAFASKLTQSQTFTIIQAGSLTSAGLDSALLGDTPFLYKTSLTLSGNAINLEIDRRTAAELGLTGNRANAFESIFDAFDRDAGLASSLLGKTNQAGFNELYNQLLPDYSGGVFHSVATGARAVMRAGVEEPEGMVNNQRRSWLQEVGFGTRHEGNGADIAYDSAGFGLAGGVERATGGSGTLGASAAYISADIDDDNRRGDSRLTASALMASVYWRTAVNDRLMLNADLTAGYAWFDSDRNIIDTDDTGAQVLQRQAGGKWSGALAGVRVGAAYNVPMGRFYLRPDVVLDYVYLYEGSYDEKGGGDAIDLAVDSRSSSEAAAEAGLTVGARFGRGFRWGPELRVAYRTNLSERLADTGARLLSGGNPFLLQALDVDQSRLLIRAAIRGGSRYANLAFEATGDIGDIYQAYEGRLIVRFIF